MNQNHTPGPWIVQRRQSCYDIEFDGGFNEMENRCPSAVRIAKITFRRRGSHRGERVRFEGNATDDANARLIAAAPDLAAALARMREQFSPPDPTPNEADALDAADAALTKARYR